MITNIRHGGGIIDNYRKTNSLEAVLNSINLGFKYIELDIMDCYDDYIIAHNDDEYKYNLQCKFSDITLEEFKQLKVYDKYTPLTIIEVMDILEKYEQIKIFFDIKVKDHKYEKLIQYIKSVMNYKIANNIYIQVGNEYELNVVINNGLKNIVFATWKFYNDDIFSEDIAKILQKIKSNQMNLLGLSICYNIFDTNILNYYKNENILLFNQPSSNDITIYNNKNIYYFI